MSDTPMIETRKGGNPNFGKGQPANYCGKKGVSGAPMNNRNAMRGGLKAGKLPEGAEYIEIQRNIIRRNLEDAIIAAKGRIPTQTENGWILNAIDGYRRAMLSNRWLREGGEKLPSADKERHSLGVSQGLEKLSKFIEKLRLDEDQQSTIFNALYQRIPNETTADGAGGTDGK